MKKKHPILIIVIVLLVGGFTFIAVSIVRAIYNAVVSGEKKLLDAVKSAITAPYDDAKKVATAIAAVPGQIAESLDDLWDEYDNLPVDGVPSAPPLIIQGWDAPGSPIGGGLTVQPPVGTGWFGL